MNTPTASHDQLRSGAESRPASSGHAPVRRALAADRPRASPPSPWPRAESPRRRRPPRPRRRPTAPGRGGTSAPAGAATAAPVPGYVGHHRRHQRHLARGAEHRPARPRSTYTPTTTFDQTVAATPADVTVGSCISAFGKPTSVLVPATRAFGEPVTATTVTITQPDLGHLHRRVRRRRPAPAGGFPGGGRRRRHRAGGFPGAGSGRVVLRPAAASAAGRCSARASGSVTAVSGSTVTVKRDQPADQGDIQRGGHADLVDHLHPAHDGLVRRPGGGQVCHGHRPGRLDRGGDARRPSRSANPSRAAARPALAGSGSGAVPVEHPAGPAEVPAVPDRSAADAGGPADPAQGGRGPGSSADLLPTAGGGWISPLRIGVAVVLVAAALLAWGLTGGAAPAYRTATVGTGTVAATLDAVGTITPVNQADLQLQCLGHRQFGRCHRGPDRGRRTDTGVAGHRFPRRRGDLGPGVAGLGPGHPDQGRGQ